MNKASAVILKKEDILPDCRSEGRDDAIRRCGRMLVTSGYVEERYIEGMLAREQSVSTAIGNLIAIPHGESDYKRNILSTGLVMLLYPEGIAWGTETVKMVIGIAAKGDEHLGVLSRIADTFEDENKVSAFVASGDVDAIHAALTGEGPTP